MRMLDANLNRSREGLRVCEDIARFIFDCGPISRELKSIRHAITSSVSRMPSGRKALCESRDSANDVGRVPAIGPDMKRSDPADIFAANMQRVKESLRVLEEVSKLTDEAMAAKFQRLRFRTYDVEKRSVAVLCRSRIVRNPGRGTAK